jgi:hypothetical protein
LYFLTFQEYPCSCNAVDVANAIRSFDPDLHFWALHGPGATPYLILRQLVSYLMTDLLLKIG